MARVHRQTLYIPQGSTYKHTFNYLNPAGTAPVDITSYTARTHFRVNIDDAATFFEGTTEDGILSIDGTNGQVNMNIPAATTAAWTQEKGYYDIEIIAPNTEVTRIIKGALKIDPEVTR